MSKPKYCSWDVRDLASDYNNWTEISDQRDTSQLKFRYNSRETSIIELNISMDTGNVSILLENSDFVRTVIFCDTCSEFSELDKVFQLDVEKLISECNHNSFGENIDVNKASSEGGTNKRTSTMSSSSVSDGFDLLNDLLHQWDKDEKN